MKLYVVVPTIMTNPSVEERNVEYLANQLDLHNLDFEIHFVCNTPMKDFDRINPKHPKVFKSVSNLQFSISRAVNSIFEKVEPGAQDVFAFVQSDCYFENNDWIKYYLEILFDKDYNAGVLGQRPHLRTNVIELKEVYQDKFSLFYSFWNDGVMMFTRELYEHIGPFDENYFGDCESQDFCYRAHKAGYQNYFVSDNESFFKYKHHSANFTSKARFDAGVFKNKVQESRNYLNSKWRQFELDNMGKTSW